MSAPIFFRTYGVSGPLAIVLHGGPGAPGSAAPLARGLADAFRVLEPWQRESGGEPLTVARHVGDLDDLLAESGCRRPALVGESWGAMLTLAYAAEHPHRVGPIILVGCGTFDPAARSRMDEILEARTDAALRLKLARLSERCSDPGERLSREHRLKLDLYVFDAVEPMPKEAEEPRVDIRAHRETWADMLRLQKEGLYPAAFSAIRSPVLMPHGSYDPHPGEMTRKSLAPFLADLEYREWSDCGHSPWLEKSVRDEFFASLKSWLADQMRRGEERA